MPTRHFDQFDVINITELFSGISIPPVAIIVNSFGNFNIATNGSGVNISLGLQGTYSQSGVINFLNFPSIPEKAIVTKIVMTTPGSGHVHLRAVNPIGGVQLLTIFPFDITNPIPTSSAGPPLAFLDYASSLSGGYLTTTFLDITDPPITRDQLIASYSNITLSVGTNANTSSTNFNSVDIYLSYEGFDFAVTYIDPSFPYSIENPDNLYREGDKVKISSITASGAVGGTVVTLDQIEQIQFDYTDPVTGLHKTISIYTNNHGKKRTTTDYIIIQNPIRLWFYIPIGFGPTTVPVDITLVPDGTQFSGSVPIGTIQIVYADVSGIYSLDETQTHDTLYIRDGYFTNTKLIMLPNMRENEVYEDEFFYLLPYPRKILAQDDYDENSNLEDFSEISTLQVFVTTINVEIPSPFIQTGFLPE